MPDPRDPLTADEAAAILGVDRSTVLRWIKKGKLPTLGRRPARGVPAYMIDRELVERRAAARREYLGLDPVDEVAS